MKTELSGDKKVNKKLFFGYHYFFESWIQAIRFKK